MGHPGPDPSGDAARGADDYQPPLTAWGHTWRMLGTLVISAVPMLEALPVIADHQPGRVPLDLVLGVAAFGIVHLRRRYPMTVAAVALTASAFSATAAGPSVLATVSAATRRVSWQLAVLAVLNVAAVAVFTVITPLTSGDAAWIEIGLVLVFTLASIGCGMYIGSRRELLCALRQRAERAEAERDLRVGKAQSDERARIAREMHDVLAHRISQVSMHAGALSFRTDLDADALRAGISEVQAQANEALTDLRGVLGVLRDPASGEIAHHPQPTYGDIPALVDRAREVGARIELADRVAGGPVPAPLGRTIYRIVQEGITNARKHAPGALLSVEISGDPDGGIEVWLHNPIGSGHPGAPGAGLGLVGLAERAQLAGGQLTYGRDGASFVVRASLPWAA